MATWRHLIGKALATAGEQWSDVIAITIGGRDSYDDDFNRVPAAPPRAVAVDDPALDVQFDAGFGGSEGVPFTLWTTSRVYFPCVYDGSEWVESVPRDPCNVATSHVGGE